VADSEVWASEHSGGARASAGRKSICSGVPLGVRDGGSSMSFNPGDGQGVLEFANSLNKRFVAVGLDRVVPEKAHAVHTVREKIDALRSAGGV